MIANALASDLRRAVSPASLADDLGLPLDPWQRDMLVSDHKRILVNCHRQSGKSTMAALRAVHRATNKPRSLILIFSPALRQSGEVLQKAVTIYRDLGRPVLAEAENLYSLILENGSRIISLPGSAGTVRGYSAVDEIIVDEASLVKDELPAAINPMLAVSGGTLIAMSTPHGKRGWWWDAWENGGKSWLRFRAPAYEIVKGKVVTLCPRITSDFLQSERILLGDRVFTQEYGCEFVEITDQAFSAESIRKAFRRDIEPLRFDMPEA